MIRLSLSLLVIFSLSCGIDKEHSPKEQESSLEILVVSEELKELGEIINLELYKPTRVKWAYLKRGSVTNNSRLLPGPTDYVLQAEMCFTDSICKKLEMNTQILSTSAPMVNKSSFDFHWLSQTQIEGVKGHVLSAKFFEKCCFLTGGFTVLNDSTILLSMYTS